MTDDRLHHPDDYCKLIYYQDLPVGVLVCRLEENDHATPKTLSEAFASPSSAAAVAADVADAAPAAEQDGVEKNKKDKKAKKPVHDDHKTYKLYVMTLGVLA